MYRSELSFVPIFQPDFTELVSIEERSLIPFKTDSFSKDLHYQKKIADVNIIILSEQKKKR